jgi:ubiquinone/menaquinone biosynthesis C-methylase UbiE
MEEFMLNRNRLIAKEELDQVDLDERVKIEARITDARATQIDLERYRDINMYDYATMFAWRRFLFKHLGDIRGKRVLDVCCGYSMTPVLFAMAGASHVVANDVAPLTLEQVKRVAEMHGVADRIEFNCGPAEKMPFADNSFDIIYGGAALHHLQVQEAAKEFSRLLAPGGKGGFQDPLGHNTLLEFARDNLNYSNKHPEKGTDRPLKVADIEGFGSHFAKYRWKGFDMTAMATRVVKKLWHVRGAFEAVDGVFFNIFPFLQRYARFSVILVEN